MALSHELKETCRHAVHYRYQYDSQQASSGPKTTLRATRIHVATKKLLVS